MDWTLLQTLCETAAIPGREEAMRAIVRKQMEGLVDDVSVDIMGNVIGTRKGTSSRTVMIAAHMDEIGFYVKFIDDKGFIRLQAAGGFDPRQLFSQRVRVTCRNGETLTGVLCYATKPAHTLTDEEKKAPPKMDQFFVDVGLEPEVVNKKVEIGDMVTLERPCMPCGDSWIGKSMDNRIGVFVMIEALRHATKTQATIHAVATAQEEVGLRGAATSSFALDPDVAIALDTTLACDHPGPADVDRVTQLGQGVAIKILDGCSISHPKLVDHLREVAEGAAIDYQLEVLPRGGTDAGAMQRSRGGNATATLSIPTRYIHTVNEMVSAEDVAGAVELLARSIEDAHKRDYSLG